MSEDELNRAIDGAGPHDARRPRRRRLFEFYRDNPDAMQSLQAPIFEDKVVDFVIEMAQVTERDGRASTSSPPSPPMGTPRRRKGQDG